MCAGVLLYPLLSSLVRSRGIWRNAGVPRIAVFAAVLFLSLSAFVLPYQYPQGLNSHVSGLSGLGTHFGTMSAAPFEEELPIYYKRLLKPAIAHFMHVHGHQAYYAFSLHALYLFARYSICSQMSCYFFSWQAICPINNKINNNYQFKVDFGRMSMSDGCIQLS